MKRALHLIMTVALFAIFSVANAQTVQCYGYARTCFNGESWQNKFVAFNTDQPDGYVFDENPVVYFDGDNTVLKVSNPVFMWLIPLDIHLN